MTKIKILILAAFVSFGTVHSASAEMEVMLCH